MSNLAIVLLIVLFLLLIGAFPGAVVAHGYGYAPVSVLGIVLIVVIILALTGRL